MLRRFNYTGRKKIPRSAVSVKVSSDVAGVQTFDAKFDLSGLDLAGHAKVYVEAYHRASYMRFDFGQISDIRPPRDRRLTDIEGGGTAQFRLKVVDETTEHGCVMAEADGVTPFDGDQAAANRSSILPVVITDLNDQVWRVDFDSYDGRPVLELNKNVDSVAQIALGNHEFFSLVYPAVIRQILYRLLRVDEFFDTDGPADVWSVQWLKFSCTLPGVLPPPKPMNDEGADSLELRHSEWIDDVVAAFCTHYKTLERFNRVHSSGVE